LRQAGLVSASGYDTYTHRIVFPLEGNLYGRSHPQFILSERAALPSRTPGSNPHNTSHEASWACAAPPGAARTGCFDRNREFLRICGEQVHAAGFAILASAQAGKGRVFAAGDESFTEISPEGNHLAGSFAATIAATLKK
jgi:hypothetical protein